VIIEVTRGHITVEISGRRVTVPGEMFFPDNDRMGFVVYSDRIRNWDAPDDVIAMTDEERRMVIDDIRVVFKKGGHVLDIE
jgi:Immunity protein 74